MLKEDKGQATPAVFLGLLVVVIIGLPLVFTVVGDLEGDFTETNTTTNENQTVDADALPATVTVSIAADEFVVNGSETITDQAGATLTENTNYTVLSYDTGQFNITDLGGTTGSVDLQFDYESRNDNFIDDSTQRLLVDQLPLLVLVLIIVGIILAAGLL